MIKKNNNKKEHVRQMSFEHYAKNINNICLSYSGLCHKYLIYLDWIADNIDMNVKIAGNKPDFISNRYVREFDKNNFSIVVDFKTGITPPHPIELFVKDIDFPEIKLKKSKYCYIKSIGEFPTKSLSERQYMLAKNKIRQWGMEITEQFNDDVSVVGVESPELVDAARRGMKVGIFANGLGTNLLKMLNANIEVIN